MKINKIIIIPLFMLMVMILGVSFALFTKDVSVTRKVSLASGNKYIGIYGSNKDSISLNTNYTFTLENRGSVDAGFEIYMDNDTELTLSNISYTISGDFSKSGTLNDSVLLTNNINAGATKTITLRLTGSGEYTGRIKVRTINKINLYTGDLLMTRFMNLSITTGGDNVATSTTRYINNDGTVTFISQGQTSTTVFYSHWTKTGLMDVSDVSSLYINATHSSTNPSYPYNNKTPSSNFIIYSSDNTSLYSSQITGTKSIDTVVDVSSVDSIYFYIDGYVPGSWSGYITFSTMSSIN